MKKILVVDDRESMRGLLKVFVEKLGFYFLSASDGQKALDIINADQEIGLVLSDLEMPGTDGYQLLIGLKKGNFKIPLIVMSGKMLEKADLDFFKTYQGFAGFLSKPFSMKILRQDLENALENS
jgi:CheY-like chemotaxis protein